MRKPGRADGAQRATVADVAATANVSTATVSRALRYPERVSPALAARVEAAIAKLAYVPDASARALATAHSGTAAIVVPDLPRYAAVVAAASRRLAAAGLATRLVECEAGEDAAELLAGSDVEGAIFVGVRATGAVSRLAARRIAAVAAVSAGQDAAGVHIDLGTAAGVAIAHLTALGHREMALVHA